MKRVEQTCMMGVPDECLFDCSRLSENDYRYGQVKEAVFVWFKPEASNHLDQLQRHLSASH